jgi:hypothetical protein
MKTIAEIKTEIKTLESDDGHKAKPALIQINAPLTLIQVEIDAKLAALKWVLK